MIFKQWQQVLDGTKTQTRRVVKYSEWAENSHGYEVPHPIFGLDQIDTVYTAGGRGKWQVGRTYAVQPGRGKKAVGRIRMMKIRRERLQEITQEDALAEGIGHRSYPTEKPPAYPQAWGYYVLGDTDWNKIEGHTYAEVCYSVLWDSTYKKPYRWEDNPECWVLDFERSEG